MSRNNRGVLLWITVGLALALVWFARHVFLLAFSGLLIALIFTSLVNRLRRLVKVSQGVGVGIVLLLLLGIAALVGLLLAPGLASEFSQLAERLPKTIHAAAEQLQRTTIYQRLAGSLPDLREMAPTSSKAFSRVTSIFSATFETITGFFLLFFVSLFLASNPPVLQKSDAWSGAASPPRRRAQNPGASDLHP